jgi:alpha-glucoside transport system permease protein
MSAVATAAAPPLMQSRWRRIVRWRPSRLILNVVLGLIALFWMVPTISLLVISFRPEAAYGVSGWWNVTTWLTEPSRLTIGNYQALFLGSSSSSIPGGLAAGSVLDSLITAVVITVPATILVAVVSSLTAYSLVFGRWRGRNVLFLFIVALMVVPVQVGLVPIAQLYNSFKTLTGLPLFGTVVGVIIFHVAFGLPFGIFLMRNFYTGIPRDLLEAGRIDGAGEWTLFRRVVMPLGLPALASLAIFQFIWVWNDLMVALIFLGDSAHVPLTVFIYDQLRAFAADYWVIATGAIISIVIPLIVFLSFQRYFVRGVLAGAVK